MPSFIIITGIIKRAGEIKIKKDRRTDSSTHRQNGGVVVITKRSSTVSEKRLYKNVHRVAELVYATRKWRSAGNC